MKAGSSLLTPTDKLSTLRLVFRLSDYKTVWFGVG